VQPVLGHHGGVGGDGAKDLDDPGAALLGGGRPRAVQAEFVLGQVVEDLAFHVVLLVPAV
jgi:hypothetical protein